LKETLIAPVSRLSIMIGQTLGGATTALIQGLIVFVIAFLIGGLEFHSGILIALAFMFLIGVSFTALGIAIASRMRDMQGFQLIINFVIMPLFFLSGALFPLTDAPPVLKTIVSVNPLTYGVEGVRYGILGTSSINPIMSLAVIGGFGLIMVLLGAYSFRKMKV
jgi:ABC-2 type transport system permease protein